MYRPGFAESLQQDSSNQFEIAVIKLYRCTAVRGPGYVPTTLLLLPNKEWSWAGFHTGFSGVFKATPTENIVSRVHWAQK